MHRNNKHAGSYQFDELIISNPDLTQFVIDGKSGDKTISFHDEKAVVELNKALLKHYYGVSYWRIPEGTLCPPIPSRAEYIHQINELLFKSNNKQKPNGSKITGIDIGVGASCIYPLIGNAEYRWKFIGTDIQTSSIKNADKIIQKNGRSKGISLLSSKPNANFFEKVFANVDYVDFSMCNPPFYESKDEAERATSRKNRNLNKSQAQKVSNFGGTHNELWTEGGEKAFIQKMIKESKAFGQKCFWFTTLVSKEANLSVFEKALANSGVENMLILPIEVGNKKARAIAWTYLSPKMQKLWSAGRWN